MGALPGALSYRQQHDNLRRSDCIDVEAVDVTTDPEEGARQIEAMKPPALKVGDKVRLSAGGERVMTVIGLYDYGNVADCQWSEPEQGFEKFPVRSLVRISSDVEAN